MKRNVIIGVALAIGVFWGIESNVEMPAAKDEPVDVVAEEEQEAEQNVVEESDQQKERYEDYFAYYMEELEELEQDTWLFYEPIITTGEIERWDEEYRNELGDLSTRLISLSDKVKKLSPPPEYANKHAMLVDGLVVYSGAYLRMEFTVMGIADGEENAHSRLLEIYQQWMDDQSKIPREL